MTSSASFVIILDFQHTSTGVNSIQKANQGKSTNSSSQTGISGLLSNKTLVHFLCFFFFSPCSDEQDEESNNFRASRAFCLFLLFISFYQLLFGWSWAGV
uniref:Uncharacterized protein n=1 Tax=Bionectria ochroleuca TaxID=29856 RepID=A0A8H7NN25_BIOOC